MDHDLSQLVGGLDRPARPAQARGRITRTPALSTDSLTVVLVNYSSDYSFEIPGSNWMPRGAALPTAGNRCLVIFDDHGDAWVPVWGADV